jgi:hypothetical protein
LCEAGRKRNCRDDRDQQAAPDHLHPQEYQGIICIVQRSITRVSEHRW